MEFAFKAPVINVNVLPKAVVPPKAGPPNAPIPVGCAPSGPPPTPAPAPVPEPNMVARNGFAAPAPTPPNPDPVICGRRPVPIVFEPNAPSPVAWEVRGDVVLLSAFVLEPLENPARPLEVPFAEGEEVNPDEPNPPSVEENAEEFAPPTPEAPGAGDDPRLSEPSPLDRPDASLPVAAGVVGAEPGIVSRRLAPNEDDGLNGLIPPKPVACGARAFPPPGGESEIEGVEDVAVAPVGFIERAEKIESEKPDDVDAVLCGASGDVGPFALPAPLPNVKADATPDIVP